jgi:hypothetical protein
VKIKKQGRHRTLGCIQRVGIETELAKDIEAEQPANEVRRKAQMHIIEGKGREGSKEVDITSLAVE